MTASSTGRPGTAPPRVSILLPVRNAEDTLDEAVASIRGQTLTEWELLAVDDGSEDRTGELLARFAEEDGRIRVLSQPPVGIVPALERARTGARSPLLARMDADDRAHPRRLELQLRHLEENPETALVGSHVRYFPRKGLKEGALRYETWINGMGSREDLIRNLWVECPLAHPTFLARAEAVEAVGGYRDRGWPEDYDLLLRLWAAGAGLGVVPRVLHHWREGPDRLSRTDPRYAPEAFRRLKLHFLARSLLRRKDGVVVCGAGPVGKAFGRTALKEGIPVRAFVDLDPRKVGQEIHGAPVIPPEGIGDFRDALAVAAVGRPGVRDEIRKSLTGAGWVEGRDFVAVA